MTKPLINSTVFVLALIGAWKFSATDFDGQISLSSSSSVRLNECEAQQRNNIQMNTVVKALVEKAWQEKVIQHSAVCKKWTEGNEVFYIALYYLKNQNEDETAFLTLFQDASSTNEKPIWIFEKYGEPSLLEKGLFTVLNNGKEEALAFADLNQDQRPEVIFATNTGNNASLYAFQLNIARRQLEPLLLTQRILDNDVTDSSVIISMEQRPVAQIKKDGVQSSIITKDAILTAHKDQWIKTER